METYTVQQVREMVEICYGSTISDRTWRNWRNTIGIRCEGHQIKTLTAMQATLLIGLAHLKRVNPRGQYKCTSVVDMYLKNPELREKFHTIPVSISGFQGKDLPNIIENLTGKKRSLRTFYRIAKRANIEFSINRFYPKDILDIFMGALG